MKRPIGLILSAIVLGLAALGFLLIDALTVFAGILSGGQSSTHPSIPHFFVYVLAALALLYLGLAVWAATTVFGILRLRPWGRYSILVIGGVLATTSLMSVFTFAATRSSLPRQPNVDPLIAQFVSIAVLATNGLLMAIGIWWLIYFTRPPVRDLFRPPRPSFLAETHSSAGVANPAAAASYSHPVIPSLPKSSGGFLSSPQHAPAAIKVLGWIFLVFAVCCLPITLLPFPAFILGFIVPVKASHFLYLAIVIVAGSIGYGLIKLKNSARLALIAFTIFGICNVALSVLPWYQNQFREYMAQFMARFTAMIPTIPGQPIPVYTYPTATIIFNSMVGVAVNIYILWLVHRHRTAFTAPPPLPEQP